MIISLNEITDAHDAGGKAVNLAYLLNNNFNVPPAKVLLPVALEKTTQQVNFNTTSEKIREQILKLQFDDAFTFLLEGLLNDFKKQGWDSVAVRSSANMEDAELISFAGQFETMLNISSVNELINAIRTLQASLYNDRVIHYCNSNKLLHADLKLSIIIQGMVEAEIAGVAFTINPITGCDKEILIEAVKGTGDNLVQGIVSPETIHYNWYNEKIIRQSSEKPILNDGHIAELASLMLRVQVLYEAPQDIEWCFYENQFYLLQSRPITAISFAEEEEWTNADFKDGGISSSVATPFMLSLNKKIIDKSMPAYLRRTGLYPDYDPISWSIIRFSIFYWNVKAVKNGVKKILGFIERDFDEDLGIAPAYEGKGHQTGISIKSIFNGVKIFILINRSIRRRIQKNKIVLEQVKEFLSFLNHMEIEKLDDHELLLLWKKLLLTYYPLMESNYFLTIYDNSNCKTLFTEKLVKYNKKAKTNVNYLSLVTGLDNIPHLFPQQELWRLSREIKNDEDALKQYLAFNTFKLVEMYKGKKPFPFFEALRVFVHKWGYHSEKELDLIVPHWEEDPTPVFQMLKEMLNWENGKDPSLPVQSQKKIFEQEYSKIKSKSLKKSIQQHRQMLWWREYMRDHSTQIYFHIRKTTLEVANRMKEKNIIDEKEDLFFLSAEEALNFAETDDENIFRSRIQKNKLYYKSFRKFPKPNEIRSKNATIKRPDQKGEIFKGIGSSQGIISAPVIVVTDVSMIHAIPHDHILITHFTDPAWTASFSRIKGLVTETGGVLSHGAIVSREFGIPAVLGVPGITQILKTGMWVEIDGDKGTVKLLAQEPQ